MPSGACTRALRSPRGVRTVGATSAAPAAIRARAVSSLSATSSASLMLESERVAVERNGPVEIRDREYDAQLRDFGHYRPWLVQGNAKLGELLPERCGHRLGHDLPHVDAQALLETVTTATP